MPSKKKTPKKKEEPHDAIHPLDPKIMTDEEFEDFMSGLKPKPKNIKTLLTDFKEAFTLPSFGKPLGIALFVASFVGAIFYGISLQHSSNWAENHMPSYFCPAESQEVAGQLIDTLVQEGYNPEEIEAIGKTQTNPCYKYFIEKTYQQHVELNAAKEQYIHAVYSYASTHPTVNPGIKKSNECLSLSDGSVVCWGLLDGSNK